MQILVATDLLARGVDVSGVSMVVNFDMPYEERDAMGDRKDDVSVRCCGLKLKLKLQPLGLLWPCMSCGRVVE